MKLPILVTLVVAWAGIVWPCPSSAQIRSTYLYSLASFTGKIPYDWARLYVDHERDETYVIYGNLVRVFNATGMETYSFGDDLDVGSIADLAVDRNGDIILLSYRGAQLFVTRCDFRGEPVGPVEIKDLPASFVFTPNRLVARNGLFYFASTTAGTVVVTDSSGKFREAIDLFALTNQEEEFGPKQKDGAEVTGFSVDATGNIYFTIAVFFRAYRLSPGGKLEPFGRAGSAPGRFGILAGIAADSRGNVVVADKLKCALLVFDKALGFVTEFGYRGLRPENLVAPDDVAVDRRDRVYVTQGRRRGVSVFSLTAE